MLENSFELIDEEEANEETGTKEGRTPPLYQKMLTIYFEECNTRMDLMAFYFEGRGSSRFTTTLITGLSNLYRRSLFFIYFFPTLTKTRNKKIYWNNPRSLEGFRHFPHTKLLCIYSHIIT